MKIVSRLFKILLVLLALFTDGVLKHTQSSKTENRFWYNGIESGEVALYAAMPPIHFTSLTGNNNQYEL